MEKQLGPYEIIGELGRGGMGVVYRARRSDLNREFALKVIGGGVGSSSAGAMATPEAGVLVERFRREARAGAALAGMPGIVGVHDIGETDGRLYIAMDFIDGVSFDKLIFDGELAPDEIARLMAAVARATASAHDAGVLHRDLKPANILISGQGAEATPWITDFGLARTTLADADVTRLTHSGEIIGTPAYMAPEQALGGEADGRADVYSLGACLYEACVGKPPFGGDSVYGVLTRVLREPPRPLRQVAPHVPEPLERICLVALAKKPLDRYQSAAELADDLERFVRGEPIRARRPANRAGRRKAAVAVAAIAVIGGAAGLTGWLMNRGDDSQHDLDTVTRELTTADRAIQVSSAYMELVQRTRDDLRALEAHWNGHWLDAGAGAAHVAAVDGAADAIGAKYPESALPAAWKALARFYGEVDTLERSDARLRALADRTAAAGDDPYPHVLFARAALAEYAKFLRLPSVVTSAAGVTISELNEGPRLRGLREQAADALQVAGASPYWPHINEGRAALDLLAAIAKLQTREYRATAEALQPLVDDPFLGNDVRRLQVTTWFLAGEYEQAAIAGEPLVQQRWIGAGIDVGRAWSVTAEAMALRGEDYGDRFERALAAYSADVETTRYKWAALVPRARCYIIRASVDLRAGKDPTADAEAAIADVDAALADHPDRATGLSVRGGAWFTIGRWRASQGGDPASAYRRALEDHRAAAAVAAPGDTMHALNAATVAQRLSRVVGRSGGDPMPILVQSAETLEALAKANPGFPVAWVNLGGTRKEQARVTRRQGKDPMPLYQAAIDATQRALTVNPDYGLAAYNLGLIWVERARLHLAAKQPAEALRGFREAITIYDRATAINPRDHEAITSRGVAHKACADALAAQGQDPEPEFVAAVADYDAALAVQKNDAPTWFNRGNALWELSRRRGARGVAPAEIDAMRELAAASYRECMTLRPDFWQAPYQLGNLLEEAGEPAAAADALEAALRTRPDLESNLGPRIRSLRAR